MRQRQILFVADADFVERVPFGKVRDRIHLLGGQIAGRAAFGLQRKRDDGVAGHLVIGDRIVTQRVKAAVGAARCGKLLAGGHPVPRRTDSGSGRRFRQIPPDRARAGHP